MLSCLNCSCGTGALFLLSRSAVCLLLGFLAVLDLNTASAAALNGIVVHAFAVLSNGTNQDGANPAAGLMLFSGVLCGTTVNGGAKGAGTLYYLAPDASVFNAFRSFTNTPDAANAQGNLAATGIGLFGTSTAGGNKGVGTVFLGNTNGTVSILRNFSAVSADNATNSGGASPSAVLALSGGTVFGTTLAGGAAANGTVFSLSTNGVTFSSLHDFSALDSNTGTNADGALPSGGLIVFGNTLYGTASGGGAGGAGVVFSVSTNGSNYTTLHSFTPLDSLSATNTDGAFPFSGLVLLNGTLFGTTIAGGAGGKGVLFSLDTNGKVFAVRHNFSATEPLTGTNWDGASPCAPLALLGGNVFGTASAGGASANGTIFSVSTNGTQFQTLHAFSAMDANTGTNSDGALPVAGLLPLGNALYGTAFSGGPGGVGTVFNVPIPLPPAVITNIVRNPDGSVTLYFAGGAGTNVIQATANLLPPVTWSNLATNTANTNSEWQFTEAIATNSDRFYRSYAP
jgi:uncharacterized repeat protein (TIGR03803 family)